MKALFAKKFFATLLLLAVPMLTVAGSPEKAAEKPVHTMAKILYDLNHYPSEEEQAKLEAIAGDPQTSEEIKTIAMAIHDMQHKVSAADEEKLQAIATDEDTDPQVRKLADIVLNIMHKPSEEDKETLMELQRSGTR